MLLAHAPAFGEEYAGTDPRRLLGSIEKSRVATVWHMRERLKPLDSVAGMACARVESKRIGFARPGREWVRRFAAAVAESARVVCETRCGVGWGGTPHRFIVRNTGLDRSVVDLVPAEGLAHVSTGDGDEGGTLDVTASLPRLLALLREVLPKDTTLARWAADSDSALIAAIPRIERAPVNVERVAPEYPESAGEFGLGGRVVVRALVAADSTVREARLVESNNSLDAAVLAALAQWRFEPATIAGKPVPAWVEIPFRFSPR